MRVHRKMYSIHMQRRNVYHTDQVMLGTSTQEQSEHAELEMMKRRRTRLMRNLSGSTCLKGFRCSILSLIKSKQDSTTSLLAILKPTFHTIYELAKQSLPEIGHTAR